MFFLVFPKAFKHDFVAEAIRQQYAKDKWVVGIQRWAMFLKLLVQYCPDCSLSQRVRALEGERGSDGSGFTGWSGKLPALAPRFKILSLVFSAETLKSKLTKRFSWRKTAVGREPELLPWCFVRNDAARGSRGFEKEPAEGWPVCCRPVCCRPVCRHQRQGEAHSPGASQRGRKWPFPQGLTWCRWAVQGNLNLV